MRWHIDRDAVEVRPAKGPCPSCLRLTRLDRATCSRCGHAFSEEDREAMLERVNARRDRHFVLMFKIFAALICATGIFLAAWWLYA